MHKSNVIKSGIITLFILFIINILSYSQNFDLEKQISPSLKSINLPLSFKKSKKPGLECFDEKEVVSSCGCVYILGYSADEEFAVLMYGPFRYTVQDSIDFMAIRSTIDTISMIMRIKRPMKVAPSPTTYHRIHINIDLNWFLQRDETHEVTQEEFDKYVTFYPEEYARTKFNADSVATYNCWPLLLKYKPYEGKYTGCQALMIEKKDKGFVTLYCFYTDEGKHCLNAFMKELDGIVWFND